MPEGLGKLNAIGSIAVWGILAMSFTLAREEEDISARTVRARKFVVVDDEGRACATLGSVAAGGRAAALTFLDDGGRVRLKLSGGERGAPGEVAVHDTGLVLFDRSGRVRGWFTVTADTKEWAMLRLRGAAESEAEAEVSCREAEPLIRATGEKGNVLFEKP
jgi:hypothetical protein